MRWRRQRSPIDERTLVFNLVWTGSVFTYLQYFVASQLAHSAARFRFVVNACPPEQLELMERFAACHPGRIVEILTVSDDDMIGHGICLDRVRAQRDDGEHFALIDPDIKVNDRFVPPLARHLTGSCAVVTSGTEVWSENNLVPPGHPGVAGEHFVTQDGFVFGSPHLAIYRREAMEATCERWSVGFGTAGGLDDDGKARLRSMGLDFILFDTGKLVNAFLQADGHTLVHEDFDHIVHIGGLAHFLAPTGWTTVDGEETPNWKHWANQTSRYQVAEFAALTLRRLCDGRPAPELPAELDPAMATRLHLVLDQVVDLVERYRGSTVG